MFYSKNFENDEDFVKNFYREIIHEEYDFSKIVDPTYKFKDQRIFHFRQRAIDVMSKLFFYKAMDGGEIGGDNITTYERVNR